jgi:SagB-type dehydrogenase family enzyme
MRVRYGHVFEEKIRIRNQQNKIYIPDDKDLWPDEWKHVSYKEYERFLEVPLPPPVSFTYFGDALIKRKGVSIFSGDPISLQEISNILYFSCGETRKSLDDKKNRRVQSSAGARYPIEVYIYNLIEGDLKQKLFHYNVRKHSLEELWDISFFRNKENQLVSSKKFTKASMMIILTMVIDRSFMKYGDGAYKYAYLEAGSIIGFLQQNAFINDVFSSINNSFDESLIEAFLDIDNTQESVVMCIMFGK